METNDRIVQWEKMTQADPDNALGWFSLGNAYKDVNRTEDAANALQKAVKLDEALSRGYELLGQALITLNRPDEAIPVLTQGYKTAAMRGDYMPQNAIGAMLEQLGQPVPKVEQIPKAPEIDPDDHTVVLDRKTGKPGHRLPDVPMRGPIGKIIYENYSKETWHEWIGMGTKVINELRLDFSDPVNQQTYEQHMLEWLGISPEEIQQYAEKENAADKA